MEDIKEKEREEDLEKMILNLDKNKIWDEILPDEEYYGDEKPETKSELEH